MIIREIIETLGAMEDESYQILKKAFGEIFPRRIRKLDITEMLGLQRMMELIKLTKVEAVTLRNNSDNREDGRNSMQWNMNQIRYARKLSKRYSQVEHGSLTLQTWLGCRG